MNTKKKPSIITIITAVILSLALLGGVVFLGVELILELGDRSPAKEISVETAEKLINDTVAKLPATTASATKFVKESIRIKVTDISYGDYKDIHITCEYETIGAGPAFTKYKNEILAEAYAYYTEQGSASINATALQIAFKDRVCGAIMEAEPIKDTLTLTAYELADGSLSVHLSDQTVDALYGGLLTAQKNLSQTKFINIDGRQVDITNLTTLRTGMMNLIAFKNYDSEVPETAGWLIAALSDFADEFYRNFIEKDRWQYIVKGLGTTLAITGCAMLIGVLLGFLVAVTRVSHDKNGSFPILNAICQGYLSLIRGTPVMVQLLIIYFVLLAPLQINKFIAAVICFGINSGAYVAEIVRGGIMSVDGGQIEAGRSLGLSYPQTMLSIVFPQAFKAVLPSLANEFIVLLKETSVAFYIGVADLTQSGILIRSITFSNFMPLVAIAVIYWIMVIILTKLVSLLERRLRQSER